LVELYPDRIALVRYHTSDVDPFYLYNPEEVDVRQDYYNCDIAGYIFVDGADGGIEFPLWQGLFEDRMGVESNLEMRINGEYNGVTREVNLFVTVTATGEVSQPDLRLFVVLTESGLEHEQREHNQVMRDMIPDAEGESFTISNGETLHFTRDFTLDNQLEDENCEIVVFVQSYSSREVLQSAKEGLTTLEPTAVEEETEILPGSFVLAQNYPNPFNASTIISFNLPEPAPVVLEIYNLSGQLLRTIVEGMGQAGNNQIIWDGLDEEGKGISSGIYFYKLNAGEWSQTRRMLLMR